MPESRVPAVIDAQSGLIGVPNDGDWLQIGDRPWRRVNADGAIAAAERVIVTDPANLTLGVPLSGAWIYNDSTEPIQLSSPYTLSGVTVIPPRTLAIVAGDGESWHSFLSSAGQQYSTAIGPVLTGSPDITIGDWLEPAGITGQYGDRGRAINRKPKIRGIAFPPQLDPETGSLILSEDVFCIRDQIFSVLRTEKGERPLRMQFGLTDRSFEVRSSFTPVLEEIRAELLRQIPELYDVTVSGIYQPVATLVLRIDWQLDERNIQPPLGFELAL